MRCSQFFSKHKEAMTFNKQGSHYKFHYYNWSLIQGVKNMKKQKDMCILSVLKVQTLAGLNLTQEGHEPQ